MLGLLSFPSKLPYVSGKAVAISLFMILVARPLATFTILSPFKFTMKEKLFISWVGLRGGSIGCLCDYCYNFWSYDRK